jgi:signal transduction histidine kinase
MPNTSTLLESGALPFAIESRIIRELGERLVKEPEVALLELIKNSYDADATTALISFGQDSIVIRDDGVGMTIDEFKDGWMRIGTSSKESRTHTRIYGRPISGEKGIGRFAVRYLGRKLSLQTVAKDSQGRRTLLKAEFIWPEFDKNADLGKVRAPYTLELAPDSEADGTVLTITALRAVSDEIDFRLLRTSSLDVVTPYRSLLNEEFGGNAKKRKGQKADPGFSLELKQLHENEADEEEIFESSDVAAEILDAYVLRAVLELADDRLSISVFSRDGDEPELKIIDEVTNLAGRVYADIRFFPKRAGTFQGLSVNGTKAKGWVKRHFGVAVFDRSFRVYPYGTAGDDWLHLSEDTAKNLRNPRSSLGQTHLKMDDPTRQSTTENYMLMLPYAEQLVGVVQVEGQRNRDQGESAIGLVISADREGFVHNDAYAQLEDFVRGALEAMAYVDRDLQKKRKAEEQRLALADMRRETRNAIREIENSPNISAQVKDNLIRSLTNTQKSADTISQISKERESSLEIMSLLGVVAGFMTHEFGTALDELERAHDRLVKLAKKDTAFVQNATLLASRIVNLRDFVTYSQGYIQGTSQRPTKPYAVKPRIQQVMRVYGKYAVERGVNVSIDIDDDLLAPLVPVSLYNGVALNLYTNSLKSITAKTGKGKKEIAFRAWDEKQWQILEVSDTGVGIPSALSSRIFDPLFTTTADNRDPLGSGMGLGLSLVRRSVESFGGKVDLVDPPPGFATCFRVRLPFREQ